jgi:hypothetical protein
LAAGDVAIPPIVPIHSALGLQGIRQGDSVTMRRDDETEQQFKIRVGLAA